MALLDTLRRFDFLRRSFGTFAKGRFRARQYLCTVLPGNTPVQVNHTCTGAMAL